MIKHFQQSLQLLDDQACEQGYTSFNKLTPFLLLS